MTRPYPAYRDSGVDWLGNVPAHWPVIGLGRRYEVVLGKMLDTNRIGGNMLAPYLRNVDVQWGRINSVDLPEMDFSEEDREKFALRLGDLLVCEGGEVGRAAIWKSQHPLCFYQKALHRLRPLSSQADTPQYLFYVLRVVADTGLFQGGEGRSTIAHLPADILRRYRFAFPPLREQQAIAAFLDREVGKIDGLVEAQRRLIALLAEKRRAVISHAVTRGLNPAAPLKPSGIDWLGDIPAHWSVVPVGQLLLLLSYGFTNPMPTTDEGPFLLTANDIGMGEVQYDTARRTSFEAYQALLTEKSRPVLGDILLTKDGTLGRVAVHSGALACINQSVAILRADESKISPAFFSISLQGSLQQDKMKIDAGGTTIKHIYISRLAKMATALPPLPEQAAIVAHVYAQTARLDALSAEAERAVSLLLERRAALISAAVTGKIDVRDEAEATEAA